MVEAKAMLLCLVQIGERVLGLRSQSSILRLVY